MRDRLRFFVNRLREQLWVKPIGMCILSIIGVFLAKAADQFPLESVVPEVSAESVETLLEIIAASMLVMAIFAVGSMVSAYGSASSSATPRAFPLVIADDVSQNALSVFIGAFIFSLVALFPLLNGIYGPAGLFTLLLFTMLVFAIVILTFVWWVDRIARLGRLGATVEKVEAATDAALARRRLAPRLGGVAVTERPGNSPKILADTVGYVRQVNVAALQAIAVERNLRIEVAVLPGAFTSPGKPLAYVIGETNELPELEQRIASAFSIGRERTFEDDPRFGLVVLAEIAGRALSPGINDPGTAIGVIGSLVRLFVEWGRPIDDKNSELHFDRVAVPALSLEDMFDDAFTAIARDGAGAIEVVVRLQKGFESLAIAGDSETRRIAKRHAQKALARAEQTLDLPQDVDVARRAGQFASGD